MKFKQKFLINFPLGLFVGSALSLSLAWGLDGEVAFSLQRMMVFVFSALLTVLVAAVALMGVLSNLDFQRQQEEETRNRKAQSARAFLSNALAVFSECATAGFRYNYAIDATGVIDGLAENVDISELVLPSEVVLVFRDLIENSTDASLRNHLFELLSEHQVLVARSKRTGWRSTRQPSAEDYRHVVHWAYLRVLAGTMLEYARRETESVEFDLSENSIQAALHFEGLLLNSQTYGLYDKHLKTYAQRYVKRLCK